MPKDALFADQPVRLISLSERITNLVGRKRELDRIDRYLNHKNAKSFLYYYSSGGLGKTRLLEEITRRAQNRPEEFRCSGIIDLYHTDVHSSTDIRLAIANGLDPDNKDFTEYRDRQMEYDRKYAREDKSEDAKKLRRTIAQIFENSLVALTKRVRVVLCFDTFEHVQFPTTIVDQTAANYAPALWLSSWLMKFLADLDNVLVVFAGRPRPNKDPQSILVSESLSRAPGSEGRLPPHKGPQSRKTTDPQKVFIETLRGQLRGRFEAVELRPLPREDTEVFIGALPDGNTVLPPDLRDIAHRVTEGRPIFLHLLVDLLRGLHPQPSELRGLLEQWKREGTAFKVPVEHRSPQEYIQAQIIRSLYNETGVLGGYLGRMALLPKGVNQDILVNVLGLDAEEASEFINRVRWISFVKEYRKEPFGAQSVGDNRLFLHDELYVLMTSPKFVPTARHSERDMANRMVSYLNGQITAQQQQLGALSRLEQTQAQRQIEQLQLEALYYSLVADPKTGYEEYRRLANLATETDNDDFGMKLLDEFLRFYNDPRRVIQLDRVNIKPERLIRDRTLMWMERLHWSEHYTEAVKFAERVMQKRLDFYIGEDAEGVAVLSNITALWARDCEMTQGYQPQTLERAETMWIRLTDQAGSIPNPPTTTLLARARLATSVGYLHRKASNLTAAKTCYLEAVQIFKQFEESNRFVDEMAFLLNNVAYLNANQGHMEEANLQANRARRYFVQLGNQRGEAYALSTLANVEIRSGDYDRAVEFATAAVDKFKPLADERGTVLALMARAQARRKDAKADILKGLCTDNLVSQLKQAEEDLNSAIELAHKASWLDHELPMLHAKRAKVYREMGLLARSQEDAAKAESYFKEGQTDFERALGVRGDQIGRVPTTEGDFESYDIRVDFAEHLFRAERISEANRMLADLEEALPLASKPEGLKPEYCRLRGKIERLRVEMAQKEGQKFEALKHAICAYSYFTRFSELDRKRKGMSNKTQELLLELAQEGRADIYELLSDWVKTANPQPFPEVNQYVERLK